MNHVKTFIILLFLMLFSSFPLLALGNCYSKSDVGCIYISGYYKPSFLKLNKFSMVKRSSNRNLALFSLKQDVEDINIDTLKNIGNFTIPYHPKYKADLLALGGSIGYKINKFRVEFETFYGKFNINVPSGYVNNNAYEYFSIKEHNTYRIMRNTGITIFPALVNICYDINTKNHNAFPFLCIGFGINTIDFLRKLNYKISYQTKAGISYTINQNLVFFIDGSFHGYLGNQFTNLVFDYPSTDNSIFLFNGFIKFNFLSANIGMRFIIG